MLRSTNILSFRLGPEKVYLINGARNVATMFRTTTSVGQDKFILMIQK